VPPVGLVRLAMTEDRDSRPDGFVGWLLDALGVGAAQRARGEAALAASNARLAETQKMGRMGNWYRDISSGEMNWSAEAVRILGTDRADRAASTMERFIASIHEDDREPYREEVARCIADNDRLTAEVRFIRPDGELRYVAMIGEPVFDADGRLIARQGIIQDIT